MQPRALFGPGRWIGLGVCAPGCATLSPHARANPFALKRLLLDLGVQWMGKAPDAASVSAGRRCTPEEKMKSTFLGRVVLAMFGLVALAAANTVPVTFTSSASGLGGPTGTGVYYYPYQLTVNGASVTVACDDYADDVSLGESWNASVNTFADLSHTLFYNNGAGVSLYRQAAWLFTQFQPTPPLTNNVNAAINYAIWDLFDGSAPGFNTSNPGSNTSSAYWLSQAAAQNLAGFNFSDFVIYTPVSGWPSNDGQPQEYIGEVPEPGTVFLFLTGLLGLAGLAWRRRRASAHSSAA